MSRPNYVYKAFDREGRLLYVGVTADLEARLAAHRSRSLWAAYMSRHTLVGPFENRADALEAERRIIREERPLYNVQGLSVLASEMPMPEVDELNAAARLTGIQPGLLLRAMAQGRVADLSAGSLLEWLSSLPGIDDLIAVDVRRRRSKRAQSA